jgi:hypothetical protein
MAWPPDLSVAKPGEPDTHSPSQPLSLFEVVSRKRSSPQRVWRPARFALRSVPDPEWPKEWI